jgi:hypothetical protein
VFSSRQLGVSGKLAFTNRLSTSVGDTPIGLTNAPAAPTGNVLTSDTGELRWDLATAGQGVVTVNTPRTKAVLGYATNQVFAFGDITVAPGTNVLGWCSLGATLTRGDTFTNDCTMLVVASGWWENTGQVWKDATKTSVGNQWGGPPMLMEVAPFTLTLPVATNRVTVWTLDPTGQRMAALPVTGSATNTILTVTTNAATIWYEIEVAQHLSGFDIWRATNFTATELTNSLISGEAAAPGGDGVPNLLKYYLGLAAKVPAAPSQLPTGSLITLSNELFLTLTYTRAKAATDVECVAEVSTNLFEWLSGPAQTAITEVIDEGAAERVTVRSLAPVSAHLSRYLRLRLRRL